VSRVASWGNFAKSLFRGGRQSIHEYTKVEEDIRKFIQNELLFGEEISFTDEASFLEEGLIDSTGILEVVGFVESRYGFKVEDEELLPENLDSVSRLGRFVRTKCGVSSQESR